MSNIFFPINTKKNPIIILKKNYYKIVGVLERKLIFLFADFLENLMQTPVGTNQ